MISLRKALQAIYYLQKDNCNSDKYSMMYLLKLLYFADRYHIRHFGLLASGDMYKAMERGPVAFYTYNSMKGKTLGINSAESYLLNEIIDVDENSIKIKHQDADELSESYIEALDFSLKTYGDFNPFELSEITHDYPEWKNKKLNEEIDIKDFFENPTELKYSNRYGITKDPFAEDEDFLQAMKEDFNATAFQLGSS